jgi:tetratricopeptide (TPR) repeat protein
MLLQPDSELFIVPAAGGEARRLGCNLSRMNSWHSWSPDGRWLVFSSKAHSDYTQLYLSRISDQGEASPPVWLAHMVDPGRAANIPEFVSLPPDAIGRIQAQFLDDYSYTRAGNEFFRAGDIDPAIEKFRQALALNPDNAMAHQRMGFLLFNAKKKPEEAEKHLLRAIQLEPANAFARFDLGRLLATTGRRTEADPHLAEAVRLMPDGYDRHYTAVDLRYALAENRYHLARYPECTPLLREVVQRDPSHARAHFLLAMTLAWQGETQTTRPHYDSALKLDPFMSRLPDYFDLLSRNYLDQGLLPEAEQAASQGLRLALDAGRADQAARLRERIQLCRQVRR